MGSAERDEDDLTELMFDDSSIEERTSVIGMVMAASLAGAAVAVAGTLLVVLAHYASKWFGVSEDGLVMAYTGLSIAAAVVLCAVSVGHDLNVLSRLGVLILGSGLEEEQDARAQRPRRGASRARRRR